MRTRLLLPLLPLLAGGCALTPSGSEGDCILAVQVGTTLYGAAGTVTADNAGALVTHTTRQRGCDDVITNDQPAPEAWKSGDSNFPANTPLYAELGQPTSDVLLVKQGDRYMEMRRIEQH